MDPRQVAATAVQHFPVSVGGLGTAHTICNCGAAWPCPEWQATVVVPVQRLSRTLITVGLVWMLAGGGLLAAFATLPGWLVGLMFPLLVGGLLLLARRLGAL